MTAILGLDISSFQLNGCYLQDDHPPHLTCASLGKSKELIDRIRQIPRAMNEILGEPRLRLEHIVIEDAFGASRRVDKALWGVIGGIIASCAYQNADIVVLRTADWRRPLGAKDTKVQGHGAVMLSLRDIYEVDPMTFKDYDEHQLDAIGVALGFKATLEAQ